MYVSHTMGAVLSWFAIRVCALMLHSGDALKKWRPQEAPDDSHSLSAGMELEERGFGTVSLKWCEQSKRAGETFEYFDSCSWHSDILSDFSGEGEDSVDALRRLEDAYIFRQTMGVSVCSGHTKARRRESVSAKDSHRDVTDTYVKPSTYSLKKGPENCVAPNLPLKLSKKDLFSFEIQPHLNTEKVKEQCTLQTVVTEPCSPHIQKQHKTETFDPKLDAGVPLEPIKAHDFSHSTPIGLDCLGRRRQISYFSSWAGLQVWGPGAWGLLVEPLSMVVLQGIVIVGPGRKWKSLRDTYNKEKRTEKEKRSGSAAGFGKRWKFFAVMGFLDPFLTLRETSGNMVLTVENFPPEDQGQPGEAAGECQSEGQALQ
ncbi:uncharacterized protein LOC102079229 [Oreochromis niloticus]|uniref:uncharacterized protein LOC102079229 n=1 Tax=Oreochromis niloticus TaxID=8128 RepID=UPI00090462D6|nr:uncharacterized protein LOC102079229 [Oreochromis niloticus]CAI5686153.1 unnamed protein product [Mustela putorius furo]